MQSAALLASSGPTPPSCSVQSPPSLTEWKVTRRAQLSPSCCAFKRTSQARNTVKSNAQQEAQSGRDAVDTIRALDSILGSTDDTDVKRDDERPAANSVPGYRNDPGAASTSSRPYSGNVAAQDFRNELTRSR